MSTSMFFTIYLSCNHSTTPQFSTWDQLKDAPLACQTTRMIYSLMLSKLYCQMERHCGISSRRDIKNHLEKPTWGKSKTSNVTSRHIGISVTTGEKLLAPQPRFHLWLDVNPSGEKFSPNQRRPMQEEKTAMQAAPTVILKLTKKKEAYRMAACMRMWNR